jgi:uncharacterized membrane protein
LGGAGPLRARCCDLSFFLVLLCVLLADMTVLSPLGLEWPYRPFRIAFSAILIAFLPGFNIIGSLFPHRDLEGIERLGYSIMASLLVSPLTALAMSFLPFGFGTVDNPAPLLIALSALTIITAITAYIRCRRAA